MDIEGWLRSLGLERYEAAFRENQIDDTVLPNLTAEDLKDIRWTTKLAVSAVPDLERAPGGDGNRWRTKIGKQSNRSRCRW